MFNHLAALKYLHPVHILNIVVCSYLLVVGHVEHKEFIDI